jgi:predicted dehydrogenase
MGAGHVRSFLHYEGVRAVAVCDVMRDRRDRAKQLVDEHYGDTSCGSYSDFRELLDRPDVDAIVNVTTEHWHTVIGVEAAKRGKHMYYEKPMGVTFGEAQAVREAVHRHGVVFQFGTQQRSQRNYQIAWELVRSGRIGELKEIITASPGGAYEPNKLEPGPHEPPETLDYEMWLGPAPWAPYHPQRVSLTWQWIRDYGLGCLSGAWGIHDMDYAQWVCVNDRTTPVEAEGAGQFYRDLRDVPYAWEVEHRYANGVRLVHMDLKRAKERYPLYGFDTMGSVFVGTEGWILIRRHRALRTHPESLQREVIRPGEQRVPVESSDHRQNFLDAIRHGRPTISPVDAAVNAECVVQQADIALRLRRRLTWDSGNEAFRDDVEANRMLSRALRSPWRV